MCLLPIGPSIRGSRALRRHRRPVSDGTFGPDLPATRANVAVAMIRARGIDPVVFLPASPFPDLSGHWAIKEIETAYVLGIVEGLPDGTFHPDDPVIRAETVTLIDRARSRARYWKVRWCNTSRIAYPRIGSTAGGKNPFKATRESIELAVTKN